MGVSPMTGPTPNQGYKAAGLQQLGSVLKQLEKLVPLFGATSEEGAAVLKALSALGKFVPPGSVSPASDANNAQQAMMRATQNNAQMQALKQQQGGGQAAPQPKAA
jgi:hypothetical protein